MNRDSRFIKNIKFASLENINAFVLSLLILGELINDFLSFTLKTNDLMSKMLLVMLFITLYTFLYMRYFGRHKLIVKDMFTLFLFAVIYILYNFFFVNSQTPLFMGALFGLIVLNLTKKNHIKWNSIYLLLTIFSLIVLTNIVIKGYHGNYQAFKISYFTVKTLIPVIFVVLTINLKNLKTSILYLLSYSILTIVFSLITYITGIGISELGVFSIIGGDKIVTSFALGQIFVILFFSFSWSFSRIKKALIIIALVILIFLMLLAGARGPLVSLALTILVFVFKLSAIRHKVGISITLLLIIGFTYTSYFEELAEENVGIQRILEFSKMGVSEQSVDINKESSGRINLYREAWDDFEDNIWFGKGIGKDERVGWYPHNSFLEILAQVGITGFLPFFILIIIWSYKFIKLKYFQKNTYSLFYFLFIFIFFESLFSGSIFMNISFWVLLVITAYLFEVMKTGNEKELPE